MSLQPLSSEGSTLLVSLPAVGGSDVAALPLLLPWGVGGSGGTAAPTTAEREVKKK